MASALGMPIYPTGYETGRAPSPPTTRADSRYAGIGHDVTVGMHVKDGRFASQGFRIRTDDRGASKEVTQTLLASDGRRWTCVRRRYRPANRERRGHGVLRACGSGPTSTATSRRTFPPPLSYRVEVFPPEGSPYLAMHQDVSCPKGTVKKTQDIKLPRGVLICGKVIEQGSGRPVAGATVQWIGSAFESAA